MKSSVIILLIAVTISASLAKSGNIVCYFTSWTIYRRGDGKFTALDVDPSLCTHILYAFVGLGEDGSVRVLDSWEAFGLKELQHLMSLKEKNAALKILVSMGGWNEGSYKYSMVTGDSDLRSKLVSNVLEFVKRHGFDGFDLDWEYPCQRGGRPSDKENFVTLLSELKTALEPEGYLLTAAVAGAKNSVDQSYDVPAIFQYLDMVNLMTYDLHGSWDPYVGHVSPLYASHMDMTPGQRQLNVAACVEHWLSKGADPQKVNLGVPFYGRSFTLSDPSRVDLYAPACGPGRCGPYTGEAGSLGYNEICALHQQDMTYVWDDEQQVPHRYGGNQWVGYEDPKSLALKVKYAKSKNLGGIMLWSLDTDDFKDTCGDGAYPLLRAINEALAAYKDYYEVVDIVGVSNYSKYTQYKQYADFASVFSN